MWSRSNAHDKLVPMAVRQHKGGYLCRRWLICCYTVGSAKGEGTTHIIFIKQELNSAGLVLLVTALLWLKLDHDRMKQFTRFATIFSHPFLARS